MGRREGRGESREGRGGSEGKGGGRKGEGRKGETQLILNKY